MACFFVGQYVFAQNFAGGFMFVLPNKDSAVSAFLPRFANLPITNTDKVSISGKNFIVQGQPYKFWGVNIVSGACFPYTNEASAIAARASKMGINLVRFHHLDNPGWGTETSLFIGGQSTRSLNPITLNRLDYFIYQLKQHGIYTNMNLNVSRTFNNLDGVPFADSLTEFGKGVTIFDAQLVSLQKEYALQLLGHVNPYTGIRLADDPALAMVEMVNENSLYGMWKDDDLQPQSAGGFLTWRHSRMLDSLWNVFLVNKYGTQTNLQAAWATSAGNSTERILEGGFEGATLHPNWQNELHGGSVATFGQQTDNAAAGAKCARIGISNATGTGWQIQFKHVGFNLQKDTTYKITFWARAKTARPVELALTLDGAPYTWYGGRVFNLTTGWQQYAYSITPFENVTNGRLTFNLGATADSVWIDDVSLREPIKVAFNPGENLGNLNIKRILYSQRNEYARQRIKDEASFYIGLQKSFLEDFRNYLRNTLGVTAPITGNNAFTGIQEGFQNENLDFYDDHAYWDHPQFPGGVWSNSNWLINNTPMVQQNSFEAIPSALSGISLHNKPITVSEYNHAAPNRYRVEMVPAMVAYGSFHGMDGLMFFEYNEGEATSWNDSTCSNFFALHRDHSVMSQFPAAAFAYRNQLLTEGTPFLINYSVNDIYNTYEKDNVGRWGKYTPYDKRIQLSQVVQAGTYNDPVGYTAQTLPSPQTGTYTTSTGQTTLQTNPGVLTTAAPRYASITGFLNNAPNTSAGPLTMVSANGFGAVSWLSLNNKALGSSDSSFITISARQQNTNMIWANGNTTVNDNWGIAPTVQFPLTITLRFNIAGTCMLVHTLNNTGKRIATKAVQAVTPNVFEVAFDQQADKTLWYALEVLPANTIEWMGTVNSDWFNAANWSCGQVPGPLSRVVINNGKTNYPLINAANVTIWSLRVGEGATVNIATGFQLITQGQ